MAQGDITTGTTLAATALRVPNERAAAGCSRPRPRHQRLRSTWRLRTIASLLSQFGLAAAATAATDEDTSFETLAIPFPFYNESSGFAAGYVCGRAEVSENGSSSSSSAFADLVASVASLRGSWSCAKPG